MTSIDIVITGPVGSGKTLAAEVITSALNMVGFHVTKHARTGCTKTPPLIIDYHGVYDANVMDGQECPCDYYDAEVKP